MSKSMLDPCDPIVELLERDQRFRFEAYVFVFEALRFAQDRLEMGEPYPSADSKETLMMEEDMDDELYVERHVSGQDLCEAIRQYALDQYGLVAKSVLGHWGISSTGDIGDIVFNLIDIGKMRKTEHDCREDFNDLFDFEEALQRGFEITVSDSSEGHQA